MTGHCYPIRMGYIISFTECHTLTYPNKCTLCKRPSFNTSARPKPRKLDDFMLKKIFAFLLRIIFTGCPLVTSRWTL